MVFSHYIGINISKFPWYSAILCFRENSASIQIVNDIEAEGVAYREEFLIEQEELKKVCLAKWYQIIAKLYYETALWTNSVLWYLQELMASLESQKKASLSSRFRRRQKTVEEQEENDRKWKRIQVSEDTYEIIRITLIWIYTGFTQHFKLYISLDHYIILGNIDNKTTKMTMFHAQVM